MIGNNNINTHIQYLTLKSNQATTSTFKTQTKIYCFTLQIRPYYQQKW